ncbi:HAMP domain-containing sensor histidine kinase [Paraclostridium ghonii]|uniref:sensor histidine kinase n=1 Tax=Paraclostridium ghonii TaxID=29358 RepID=UPI00202CBE5D|nr:HAMP domain-containing sensor histidine kinase [Paeniclostridium ghonii]MCM0166064.1 HAMP domain-containing histidine kinase [Paeniclostridium ghonii]
MKWKITLRYVISIICVVMLVTVLNIIGIFVGVVLSNHKSPDPTENNLTREFSNYIHIEDDKIGLSKEGKDILDEKGIWIQILDENSNQVYSYNSPKGLNTKYTPIELINGYKYAGGLPNSGSDNILVSSKKIGDIEYTYLLGFDNSKLNKFVMIYNPKNLLDTVIKIIRIILFIDLIIALIVGYIFSINLTKPMRNIIKGVENLEEGKFDIYYKEKGLYVSVYKKLNKLSDTLKSNETERNKLDKLKEEWIANISHDIKTPLSSIKGYAEILSDEEYEINREEAKEYGVIINEKSEYIKELVDDLNLTMKLKNSDRALSKKYENIVRIVKDSVIQILNDPKYSNRDIEFISNKDYIEKSVDSMLFKRVINNLVYNALIHNNKDVKIKVEVDYKNEDEIIINIEDNGKGIEKKDLERIFERYYRGTNTGESHKGSGLGMAIAKDIVIAHGFDIHIISEVGKGTQVKIFIN